MSQVILFTYALALVVGFISIGTTGVMVLLTKRKTLLVSFLLYSAYTLDMFAEIVHRYMLVNTPELWEMFSTFWNPVMIFSRFFLLFSILIFSHYFNFKECKKRFAFIYAIFTTACFFISLVVYINRGKMGALENTIPDYIYFSLICLILAAGIVYIIRSKQAESEFLDQLEYPFLKKVIIFFAISSPLIINDDFSFIGTPLRFAPLIYTLFSSIILHHIYRLYLTKFFFKEHKNPSNSILFQKYSISEREKETILLVLKGYSNKQICKSAKNYLSPYQPLSPIYIKSIKKWVLKHALN